MILVVAQFFSCATTKYIDKSTGWIDVVVTEDVTVYVDTASIQRTGGLIIAREKKTFEPSSRKKYIDETIKQRYEKLGNPEKANEWSDFSYSIYTTEYDCPNKQFRILSVEDYDSQGKRILKTTPNPKKLKWVYVDAETLVDYTFFFVCDYGN